MARIKKNDPVAIREMGKQHNMERDYNGAVEYWKKAAELGDAGAHYELSVMYHLGRGVEEDMVKELYHLEEAVIAGHPGARHNLGCEEAKKGRPERARKHFIINANLGYHKSLEGLKMLYVEGNASKEDYADALRAYQAALEETKSAERKIAEAYYSSSCR
jgi:TPR repeat protein